MGSIASSQRFASVIIVDSLVSGDEAVAPNVTNLGERLVTTLTVVTVVIFLVTGLEKSGNFVVALSVVTRSRVVPGVAEVSFDCVVTIDWLEVVTVVLFSFKLNCKFVDKVTSPLSLSLVTSVFVGDWVVVTRSHALVTVGVDITSVTANVVLFGVVMKVVAFGWETRVTVGFVPMVTGVFVFFFVSLSFVVPAFSDFVSFSVTLVIFCLVIVVALVTVRSLVVVHVTGCLIGGDFWK